MNYADLSLNTNFVRHGCQGLWLLVSRFCCPRCIIIQMTTYLANHVGPSVKHISLFTHPGVIRMQAIKGVTPGHCYCMNLSQAVVPSPRIFLT